MRRSSSPAAVLVPPSTSASTTRAPPPPPRRVVSPSSLRPRRCQLVLGLLILLVLVLSPIAPASASKTPTWSSWFSSSSSETKEEATQEKVQQHRSSDAKGDEKKVDDAATSSSSSSSHKAEGKSTTATTTTTNDGEEKEREVETASPSVQHAADDFDVVLDSLVDTESSILVSPIVNREIVVSVKAHAWPTTPQNILCEAYAYHQQLDDIMNTNSNDSNDRADNNNNNNNIKKSDNKTRSSGGSLATAFLNRLVALVDKMTALLQNEDDDSIIDLLSSYSYSAMRDLALQASPLRNSSSSTAAGTSGTTGGVPTQLQLLKMSLSLRASNPLCEVHRGLARQTLQQSRKLERHYTEAAATAADDALFCVIHPAGQTLLLSEMAALDWKSLSSSPSSDERSNQEEDTTTRTSSSLFQNSTMLLLPTESIIGKNNAAANNAPFVILYANFLSASFVRYYNLLNELGIPHVVRFQGAVHYEEYNGKNVDNMAMATPMALQGYGVRLDIRNVEYKVFDDRRSKTGSGSSSDEDDAALINITSVSTAPPRPPLDFLAGVHWKTIQQQAQSGGEGDTKKDDDDDELPWFHKLWETHERQQRQSEIIPPIWQRRQLPLQAATVLCENSSNKTGSDEAADVLQMLQDISHNLPSLASTLVKIEVNEDVLQAATRLKEHPKIVAGRFYVNGRAMSFDRPTFNVFEYLNILREEDAALNKMQKLLTSSLSSSSVLNQLPVLRKIQKAWMQGVSFDKQGGSSASKNYRIDVGRGWKQSIVYLNDIEKDVQYAQWSRSVRMMLQQMQYGMPPTVRRNLFTILAVMDPLSGDGSGGDNVGFQLGMQLMQNSYPVRLGVLMVNQNDINLCAEWLSSLSPEADDATSVPCPVKPLFDGKRPTMEELGKEPATAQAVHRLLAKFSQEYGSQSGALVAYVEFLVSSISDKKMAQDFISMNDLLDIHANLLEGMGIMMGQEAHAAALSYLLDPEDTASAEDYLYGKALRFAAEKAIGPDMSFLNGLPLPSTGGSGDGLEAVSRIFSEEQRNIFHLVAKSKITDSSPKSIYAFLLTGDGVFKKAHPLLCGQSGDSGNSYLHNPHVFGPESLLFAQGAPPTQADVYFVVEYRVDFGSVDGLQNTAKMISALDTFPITIADSSNVDDDDAAGDAITSSSVNVKVGYRILPNTAAATQSPLCPILSQASLVGVTALTSILEKLLASSESGSEESLTLEGLLDGTVSNAARDQIISVAADGFCAGFEYLQKSQHGPSHNVIAGNGRFFETGSSPVSREDVELLLALEGGRAKAVAELLKEHLENGSADEVNAAARVATFLSAELAKAEAPRSDILDYVLELEKKGANGEKLPLRFSWNEPADDDLLKVQITAVLDPVAETTQRWVPFLLAIRDEIGLPLNLILSPALLIDGDSKVPITSFYRFVANTGAEGMESPEARFSWLPTHLLTIRMDVPESWDVQQTRAIQDTDNLQCDVHSGCSDEAHSGDAAYLATPIMNREHVTHMEYGLNHLLVFGQCYEHTGSPPNGLQLELSQNAQLGLEVSAPVTQEVEIGMDGTASVSIGDETTAVVPLSTPRYADTLVMKNVGYWQLRANPGVWKVSIAEESKGAEMFDLVDGEVKGGLIQADRERLPGNSKMVVLQDFVNHGELLFARRRPGYEKAKLFFDDDVDKSKDDEVIHVFSLATGHLYERFLKIMMLSVVKRTSSKVKFWLFENFLSPTFKATARAMAARIGCEVEFVTYKWPEWLRGQSEKQRIIWGYKILFLDVLFPLNVKKIIYVDADQVIRADLKELWDMDLQGAAYGYTPFCTSRKATLGYQFWREGFWKNHLRDRPYHISALYVVDLDAFRRQLVGDQLRSIYQQLSADPNSLSNLDQDLPNYAQHQVPIFSLPQEWLWCESWCSDETKATAKTIDLCNNPMHKEPKVSMAKRVIDGPLFNESWVELDAEVERYEKEYLSSLLSSSP